jgi:signal transduction histidine kinase
MGNASEYPPVDSEVVFRAGALGTSNVISVEHQGIGISANDVDRIFEPFFRADNVVTMAETGIGLGLFITKSIIEMHQMRIHRCESSKVFSIPLITQSGEWSMSFDIPPEPSDENLDNHTVPRNVRWPAGHEHHRAGCRF